MYYDKRVDPFPASYPYGLSGLNGMGQIVPGIRPETTQLVLYGSVILVVGSALIYFLSRNRSASAKGAAK